MVFFEIWGKMLRKTPARSIVTSAIEPATKFLVPKYLPLFFAETRSPIHEAHAGAPKEPRAARIVKIIIAKRAPIDFSCSWNRKGIARRGSHISACKRTVFVTSFFLLLIFSTKLRVFSCARDANKVGRDVRSPMRVLLACIAIMKGLM